MIRVLVVDDSAFMRKMISDILHGDPRIEVVAKARDGMDAIEKIQKYDPDVVTLDVEMPEMNGIETLTKIMECHPRPVIMVSSVTKKGADTTIQAMEIGAFDFISKPSGSISLDFHKVREDLVNKIVHAASNDSVQLPYTKKVTEPVFPQVERISNYPLRPNKIVAIGTSTGGPKALQKILPKINGDFPAPILIVQHMPKGFTKSLSERLNSISQITVKEAEDGEVLKKGIAYIAPGGSHLKIKKIGTSIAVHLDQTPLMSGHRPSVDTMFYSIAEVKNQDVMAVVLTGMGSDGMKGLMELRKNNRTIVIAESKETAVVFGMPRAVIESNQVDKIVPLDQVSIMIEKFCQ
ncbi:protein-glutamate methylesterase/protein-glutamine glutaminase [Evansella tamaricis]|uniref:Protein-glutamate methylesterase/protein-glutamine glutaminase n=1 Tax=Evansella tamaricis TaxID=2069301 RepID=A0ABS6JQG1_9BACI|nr:chemotaxis response regulator protein-glutamate methylesterase [Evansella tamaricis]MBU9714533.1 chemotaxis response regulator protein-glutamate methylesterase [Evansella tamaricis]